MNLTQSHIGAEQSALDRQCHEWAEEARQQAWCLVHAQIEDTECAALADRIIAARTAAADRDTQWLLNVPGLANNL